MPKINPAIHNDINHLIGYVNLAGRLAATLIARGMDEAVIKKVVKQQWGKHLYGVHAKLILKTVLHLWG